MPAAAKASYSAKLEASKPHNTAIMLHIALWSDLDAFKQIPHCHAVHHLLLYITENQLHLDALNYCSALQGDELHLHGFELQ